MRGCAEAITKRGRVWVPAAVEAAAARGVGVLRSEAHVRAAMEAGITEAMLDQMTDAIIEGLTETILELKRATRQVVT